MILLKIDRASSLLSGSVREDSACFPWEQFHSGQFDDNATKALYSKFKARHSHLRLGYIQFKSAILSSLEKLERELAPEMFTEENFRVSSLRSIDKLLCEGFQRLSPIVNKPV